MIAAAVALLLLGAGLYWRQSPSSEAEFLALAEGGKGVLAQVTTAPSLGAEHLPPGQPHQYPTRFPTSGPHDPRWTEPGFHETRQPATQLVHALEHGNVVIYYDQPGPEALKRLKDWADLYRGPWDGIIVTPSPGLGEAIVLTAWTKLLRLEQFEPESAAAFIDAFRGRGPENPVR